MYDCNLIAVVSLRWLNTPDGQSYTGCPIRISYIVVGTVEEGLVEEKENRVVQRQEPAKAESGCQDQPGDNIEGCCSPRHCIMIQPLYCIVKGSVATTRAVSKSPDNVHRRGRINNYGPLRPLRLCGERFGLTMTLCFSAYRL